MRLKQTVSGLILIVLLVFVPSATATAQYSSPNYKIDETFIGSGGELDTSSSNYRARQAAGALAAGPVSSSNYSALGGFVTPETPFLELVITASTIDLGVLSTASASTGSGSFTVRTYLSSGYSVYTMSQPPTNESGNVLAPMTSAAASNPGTEQFGINLVANTSPATFGANPANVPDNTFADGTAAAGYATANQFRYNVGDIIASSPKTATNQGVGRTDYTISYIANSSLKTKAGLYTMRHDLVAVGTF